MPKNLLQDVLSRERRTIRQVPLPSGRTPAMPEEEDVIYERPASADKTPPERGGGFSRLLLWAAAGLCVAALLVLALGTLRGATVTVSPKSSLIALNHSFVAQKTGGGTEALRFETVTLEETAESTIPADTEKRVSEKASGRIVIYNNFGEKPQRLIKNTRFETPDGLIYRIDKSVVVPGRRTEGTKIVPGNSEVFVYADSPGAEYNIALSDFTIPGFKNDPARFAGFYARSKTPMAGGREGLLRTPSESAERAAREKLKGELRARAIAAIGKKIPNGSVLPDGAVSFAFESLPLELAKEDARIRERVVATGYTFTRPALSSAIAREGVRGYDKLPVEIPNLEGLSFTFTDTQNGATVLDTLRFGLKGAPRVVWTFDADKLQTVLAGSEKRNLAAIVGAFPTIERIDVVIRPFWSRRFPENPKKIEIEIAAPVSGQ